MARAVDLPESVAYTGGVYVTTPDTCDWISIRRYLPLTTTMRLHLSSDDSCGSDIERQDCQVIAVLEAGFSVAINGDWFTVTVLGGEGLSYRAG